MPSGDLIVLTRGFTLAGGVAVRLELVPADEVLPGAILRGRTLAEMKAPLTVDNFEGVDVRAGKDGETLLYLLSDDNFSRSQRTLLLMFALGAPPAK